MLQHSFWLPWKWKPLVDNEKESFFPFDNMNSPWQLCAAYFQISLFSREIKFYLVLVTFSFDYSLIFSCIKSKVTQKATWGICQLMRNWILFLHSAGHVTIFWKWSVVEKLWEVLQRTIWIQLKRIIKGKTKKISVQKAWSNRKEKNPQ